MPIRFFAKRGHHGADDTNTIAAPPKVRICVGDVYGYEAEVRDESATETTSQEDQETTEVLLPPLIETNYAPVLHGSFANMYRELESLPPACHILFIEANGKTASDSDAEEASSDESEDKSGPDLVIKMTFLDEGDQVGSLSEEEVEFDLGMPSPPEDEKLTYRRLLLIFGQHEQISEIVDYYKPHGIHVIDVSDDSETGFPISMSVQAASNPPQTLALVETLPEMETTDDFDVDVDEEESAAPAT